MKSDAKQRKQAMKNIYLIDYIGRHGNTDIFLKEYAAFLTGIPGISKIEILSNFSSDDTGTPFFIDHYKGKIFTQISSLYKNFHRLKHFIEKNPENIYIYISYGNWIDTKFINIMSEAPNGIVDIQSLNASSDTLPSPMEDRAHDKMLNAITHGAEAIICHSDSVADNLETYCVPCDIIQMPSLNYNIYQTLDSSNLRNEFARLPESADLDTLFAQAKSEIAAWIVNREMS